jgi:hypothetical protein
MRHRRDHEPTEADATPADQTLNNPADGHPTEAIGTHRRSTDENPTEAAHPGEGDPTEIVYPMWTTSDDSPTDYSAEVISAKHGVAYDPLEDSGFWATGFGHAEADDEADDEGHQHDGYTGPEDSGPTRTWRWRRIGAYAAGLLLLIGVGVALTHGSSSGQQPVTRADDQRASRNDVRATVTLTATESAVAAAPVPVPTMTALPQTSAPPTAAPTTAPTTTAPKTTAPRTSAPKASAAPVAAGCSAYSGNRLTACAMLPSFGFSTSEMSALSQMWENESGWDETAENPGSGAYGIPQALPGSKMASAGADWQTNAATQIRWGLGYIKERYGSPSAAWSFWQSNNWY